MRPLDATVQRLRGILAAVALLGWPAGALASPEAPIAGQEALDYGFRFASSLNVDPKDKGKAQQAVVTDYIALGLIDQALARVEAIEGWYRPAVTADLATALARAGRSAEARALLARIETQQHVHPGWEGPRVAAHVAQAHAALGDVAPSERIASDLAENDPRQYTGRAAAILSDAHGSRGEYDLALAALRPLEGDTDIEVAWWRTVGYLELSRKGALDVAQRRSALDAARRSAEGLPGWKQAEVLQDIAARYRELGQRDGAREALALAERQLEALPPTDEGQPVARANLARAWAEAGNAERARRLLAGAETAVPKALDLDRPALYAKLASSWLVVGDEREARRLYDQALAAVESLENARPRALAVVEVCRSLGRSRVLLEPGTRARLDGLLGGLKDPW